MITPDSRNGFSTHHGGPYDRGSADSYYGRPRKPHYFVGGTYNSEQINEAQMTPDEIKAYNAGYETNEREGNKKDWG